MNDRDERPNASDAISRAAVFSAVAKWAREVAKNERAKADAIVMDAHDRYGADSVNVEVCGRRVGKLSVATSQSGPDVTDVKAFEEWMRGRYEDGDSRIARHVTYDVKSGDINEIATFDSGRAIDRLTGEVIPGVEWRKGGEVKGTRLTGCKPADVSDAMRAAGVGLSDVLPSGAGLPALGEAD